MSKRYLVVLAIAVLVVSFSRPASAQNIDDMKRSMKLMQVEIDRLQSALNADLGEARTAGWLDWSVQYGEKNQLVMAVGWALSCGKTDPAAQVMVDGVIADDVLLVRYVRADVTGMYSAYCTPYGGLLPEVGATFIVDLSNYGPGQHTIQLRIRDTRGYEVKTNTLTVTL